MRGEGRRGGAARRVREKGRGRAGAAQGEGEGRAVCGKEEGGSAVKRREAGFYFQKKYFISLASVLDLGTRQSFFFIFFFSFFLRKNIFFLSRVS